MKRVCFFLVLLLLLSLLLSTPVAADEEDGYHDLAFELPTEFGELLEALPSDLIQRLPSGVFSSDPFEVEKAVKRMTDPDFLMTAIAETLGTLLGEAASLLGGVIGLLLLCATVNGLRTTFAADGVGKAFSLCIALTLCGALIAKGYGILQECATFFSTLNAFCAACLPLICVLYAIGGNLGAGVASASGLSIYMTLLEEVVGSSVLPFCALCVILAAISALNPRMHLNTLASTVKKNYTTALAFLMMLLLAVLSTQTFLSVGADTLAMRSAKFAASNALPIVGGSISELLRTVGAGVGYLRSTLGVCATVMLLLTLLPMLLRLLLLRLVWQLAASVAELLSCDAEKKLLDEFASLCGYLLSAVCICSSVLLLSLASVVKCASAIS